MRFRSFLVLLNSLLQDVSFNGSEGIFITNVETCLLFSFGCVHKNLVPASVSISAIYRRFGASHMLLSHLILDYLILRTACWWSLDLLNRHSLVQISLTISTWLFLSLVHLLLMSRWLKTELSVFFLLLCSFFVRDNFQRWSVLSLNSLSHWKLVSLHVSCYQIVSNLRILLIPHHLGQMVVILTQNLFIIFREHP